MKGLSKVPKSKSKCKMEFWEKRRKMPKSPWMEGFPKGPTSTIGNEKDL